MKNAKTDQDVILCRCKKCNTDKPIDDFYPSLLNRARTEGTCTLCWNLYTAERRRARDIKQALQSTKLSPLDPLTLHLLRYVTELGAFVRTLAAVNRIEDMAPCMSPELQAMLGNLPPAQVKDLDKSTARAQAVRRRALDEGRTADGQKVQPTTDPEAALQADKSYGLNPPASTSAQAKPASYVEKGIKDTLSREGRIPASPWPKRASDVTPQELQEHLAHLKALIATSEANPLTDFATPRGTVMRGGKEYGADGELAVTELDPVYQALSRERSKPDSLDTF